MKLADFLAKRHIALGLVHLHAPAKAVAEEGGLMERVPDDHVFPNLDAAVDWATSLI